MVHVIKILSEIWETKKQRLNDPKTMYVNKMASDIEEQEIEQIEKAIIILGKHIENKSNEKIRFSTRGSGGTTFGSRTGSCE